MEYLFRGRKLDCWYCSAPLKARGKGHVDFLVQSGVGLIPLADSLVGSGTPDWLVFAGAGLIIAAIQLLPPGFVHGAPWVRIVNRKAGVALQED
jgi:hypothetical protein